MGAFDTPITGVPKKSGALPIVRGSRALPLGVLAELLDTHGTHKYSPLRIIMNRLIGSTTTDHADYYKLRWGDWVAANPNLVDDRLLVETYGTQLEAIQK